jgi:hypothetical protein
MEEDELFQITKKLLSFNHDLLQKFEDTKESGVAGDFYQEIKPFSEQLNESLKVWSEGAKLWIRNCRPKNLHVNQIESVMEQLEMISVQAFFPQTSRTHFLNTVHSVEYVLKKLVSEIEKECKDTK